MMTIPEETTAYDRQYAGEALETLEKILRFYIADRRERALEALTLYFASARLRGDEEGKKEGCISTLAALCEASVLALVSPITAAEVEAAQR